MKSIKVKLLVLLMTTSVLGMLIVAGVNLVSFSNQILEDTKEKSMNLVKAEAAKIEGWLNEYGSILDSTAKSISAANLNDSDIKRVLGYINSKNNYIGEAYIGFEDKKFILGSDAELPPGFDATSRDWYKKGMQSDKPTYTEPYVDVSTKKLVVSIVAPFINQQGNKIGVAGADIQLDSIADVVNKVKVGKEGYAFLVDSKGTIIGHKDEKLRGTNINENKDLSELDKVMKLDKSGDIRYVMNGEEKIAFFQTIENTGWKIAVTLPYDEIQERMTSQVNESILIIILIALMVSAGAYFIAVSISRPITKINQFAVSLANGDLTSKDTLAGIKQNDEIGQLTSQLTVTAENLESMIKSIKNTSRTVATAANEISMGNEDLSQRTQEQAASLEETSSAIEELTATVKQNADNAQSASSLSTKIMTIVNEGDQVLKETIHSMQDATNSSKKINEIINVVNDIAFQTNLLALNAAVEAARAGEQGKGFAVVAVEVRNLAQRSADAAKEIQSLIKDSVEKIENSNELVQKTGLQLSKVTENIKNMTQLVSEIAAASKEQSVGIEEVNNAITQMDQVTQQNAALVEESAASSEAMKTEANELLNLVAQFKISNEEKNIVRVDKKEDIAKKENRKNSVVKGHKSGFDGFEKF